MCDSVVVLCGTERKFVIAFHTENIVNKCGLCLHGGFAVTCVTTQNCPFWPFAVILLLLLFVSVTQSVISFSPRLSSLFRDNKQLSNNSIVVPNISSRTKRF